MGNPSGNSSAGNNSESRRFSLSPSMSSLSSVDLLKSKKQGLNFGIKSDLVCAIHNVLPTFLSFNLVNRFEYQLNDPGKRLVDQWEDLSKNDGEFRLKPIPQHQIWVLAQLVRHLPDRKSKGYKKVRYSTLIGSKSSIYAGKICMQKFTNKPRKLG